MERFDRKNDFLLYWAAAENGTGRKKEKMEILVYGLQLCRTLTGAERVQLEQMLPAERRHRLMRTRADKQTQILCAYGLLAWGLRRLGWPRLPEMALTAEGKPWFPGEPGLCFNLSHTDGAVLCAIHDHPLGVDVERYRPAAPSVMERCGTADLDKFWRIWVQREAIAKCRGKGVGVMLHWDAQLEAGVFCRTFSPFPQFYAAMATEQPDAPWRCREVDMDELLEK